MLPHTVHRAGGFSCWLNRGHSAQEQSCSAPEAHYETALGGGGHSHCAHLLGTVSGPFCGGQSAAAPRDPLEALPLCGTDPHSLHQRCGWVGGQRVGPGRWERGGKLRHGALCYGQCVLQGCHRGAGGGAVRADTRGHGEGTDP